MARIRTVKPEFWGDPKTARCTRDARLLFLGLLNESDDEGRQLGTAKRIAGAVFPNDPDVTEKMVNGWLDELERARLARRYSVEGVTYLLICGFDKHQKISHAAESRLPSPPEEAPENLPKSSGEPPEILAPDLVVDLGIDLGTLAPGDPARNGSGKSPRKSDAMWDALISACGIVPADITPSSRGGYNRALKEIREAGATCEDIATRARFHRAKWTGASLTPTSLAKHWAELGPPPKRQSEPRANFQEAEYVDEPF